METCQASSAATVALHAFVRGDRPAAPSAAQVDDGGETPGEHAASVTPR